MAEYYEKILPGNWVAPLNAYPQPGPDFKTNARVVGDPRDRIHQAVVTLPGWKVVRKAGYIRIADAGATSWSVILPSPDTRSSDKPRADVVGLFIPTGVALYRVGIRVFPKYMQPGFSSSGPRSATDTDAGITGTTGTGLTLASVAPAAASAASIGATAVKTSTLPSTAAANPLKLVSGRLAAGSSTAQTVFGSPVVTTADMTLSVYSHNAAGDALGAAIGSDFLGGVYVAVEACYLVPEAIVALDELNISGVTVSGMGS
jgi:hypothetical protein